MVAIAGFDQRLEALRDRAALCGGGEAGLDGEPQPGFSERAVQPVGGWVEAVALGDQQLPANLEQAAIRFGADPAFELPIHRLAGNGSTDQLADDPASGEAEASPLETDAVHPRPDLDGATGEPSPVITVQTGDVPTIAAHTRQEATVLLQQVGAFYRMSEPASPIPLLTDRACAFVQKDFLTLLKDVLPGLGVAISG